MSRVRLPLRRWGLFALLTAFALIVLLPMGLALSVLGLSDSGLTARAVRGSVWGARLSEAAFGTLAIGDVEARLRFFPLFVGRARVDLDGTPGRGSVTIGRHAAGIDDVTAAIVPGAAFAPIPIAGLDLQAVSVRFRDGSCQSAEGRVSARFSGDVGGIPLAQGLSGAVRCDAGALLIPLVSQSANAGLAIRVTSDGRWRAEFNVRAVDPALAAPLGALGFQPGSTGWTLRVAGMLTT